MMKDTELAGIKQPPQATQASQEWAARILPVLDGSKLQTMRKRVAAALDQAQAEERGRTLAEIADRLRSSPPSSPRMSGRS